MAHRGGAVLLALVFAGIAGAAAANPTLHRPWPGFQIIMWQAKTAHQYAALRELGVTAAKVQADRGGETSASATQKAFPIVTAGLRLYVENIATDFYSPYHRWFPDKPVNWKFLALKQTLESNPIDRKVFEREPSLSDRVWLDRFDGRLKTTVRSYAHYRPLFLNLGDETGIADLSAAWDFDFSAPSLSAMRAWLKRRYGSLAALNREWGTRFKSWSDVVPDTTTQAMARRDENYASWSDFKEWMDVSFARAIGEGTNAIHAAAPWARSAIEGAQMPGWGGYDYSRLATAVDVMEMYDAGDDVDIAQSFNPGLVILTTSSWTGSNDAHRAWREFLRGARGVVLWDDKDQFVELDGTPGPLGRAAGPFFNEIRGGLGTLLMDSRRHSDPIAVLYSPASFRVQWMLDHRAVGSAWIKRDAETENADNAERAARRRTLERLGQMGFTPRFVSEEQVARGILHKAGYRMLVLPQTLALSPEAAGAIRGFVRAGGALAADGDTGAYDGHGRRLPRPQLARLLHSGNPFAVQLPRDSAGAMAELRWLTKISGLMAEVTVETASGEPVPGVKQYVFHKGATTLVALLADPAADGTNQELPVTLVLSRRAYATDARLGAFLGRSQRLAVGVGSATPTVLALRLTRR